MTTTQSEITEERLREILAGLEGVTPGPWKMEGSIYDHMGAGIRSLPDDRGFAQLWKSAHVAFDAKHIARCDPDTMRHVLTLALDALTRRSSAGAVVTDEIVERAIPHLRNLNIAGKDGWRRAVRAALTAALEPLPSHAGEDDVVSFDALRCHCDGDPMGHERDDRCPSPSVPPQGDTKP